MLESHMRQVLVGLLKKHHAVSVENGLTHPGTPDINFVPGWIECKATEHWPARAETVVKLDHDLTPQQRIWLVRRKRAGGACWVMITVDRDWLLFDGAVAAEHVGKLTKAEMFAKCLASWNRTPTTEELEQCFLQVG